MVQRKSVNSIRVRVGPLLVAGVLFSLCAELVMGEPQSQTMWTIGTHSGQQVTPDIVCNTNIVSDGQGKGDPEPF